MKKIVLVILAALSLTIGAKAQENPKAVWGKGRYMELGYAWAETAADGEYANPGKFGFFIRKGATYLFPRTEGWFGNILKVGFDINWIDVNVAKYKDSTNWDGIQSDNWDSVMPDYGDDYDDEDDGGSILGFDPTKLGKWSLMFGALGIGPNVTVAPFAHMGNAARFLRASIYFHYQPTMGMYLVSNDGDTEISYAYCNMFQFGGKIKWKGIGLGVEGHWGSGKFKPFDFESTIEDGKLSTGENYTRKFASTRLYLSFSF